MAAKVSKVYRASDVCEIAQVQSYVLRSWEKEFPGIGVQKSVDSLRLYRQSDLDQVLRIKQLVFGEGLTLSGARRRLDETGPVQQADAANEVAEVLDALASDARTRIASVRDGLRSILKVLSSAPGTVIVVDDFRLEPSPAARPAERVTASKTSAPSRTARPASRMLDKAPARAAKKAGKSSRTAKRSRASA